MKTAEEWASEYIGICANDPAVHGQMLPTPQMVVFIKRIQNNALWHAAQSINNIETRSEDRALAIDEARDLVAEIAQATDI